MQQRGMGFENTVQELARVGGVHATGSTTLPWVVTDAAEQPIAVIGEFLRDFVACGNSAASCRSYAYDLLRWWRFLATVGVAWDRAERAKCAISCCGCARPTTPLVTAGARTRRCRGR